jgi:hypothetical protein
VIVDRRLVWLERAAIVVVSLAVAVLLISLLSGYFTTRDQGAVAGSDEVGLTYVDQGDALLAPGSPHPRYDSDPPTSGPHVPAPVHRDGVALSDDQLLTALAAGDVVLFHPGRRPPRGLAALARSIAGPFTSRLASSGNAVIVAPRTGTRGIVAAAWTHLLHAGSPSDPLLRQFAEQWLGIGAAADRRHRALPGRG